MSHPLLLLLLAACASSEGPLPATAEIDPTIATIPHVHWETPDATVGWVEYGTDTSYGKRTPLGARDTDHDVALLGLPADTTCHFRIHTEGALAEAGEDQTVTTGALPTDLPTLTVERLSQEEDAGDPGYTLLSWWSIVTEDSFVAIVDDAGRVVWYTHPDWGYANTARLSADGTAILVLLTGLGNDPDAHLERVPLDGSAVTTIPTPNAHHDFLEIENGGIVYLHGEAREVDGRMIIGDGLVEVAADGTSREVWNAFDRLAMDPNPGLELDPGDWTHANGIAYDPDDDAYLVSLFWYRSVLKIDRATGDRVWTLGGDRSDFTFLDDPGFGPQHAPEWTPEGLGLFDNAYDGAASRAVEYALDTDRWTAKPIWSWAQPAGTFTRVLGDADRLEGGGAISAWGEQETVLTTAASGEIVRRISLDADGMMGQVEHLDDLYPAGSTWAE